MNDIESTPQDTHLSPAGFFEQFRNDQSITPKMLELLGRMASVVFMLMDDESSVIFQYIEDDLSSYLMHFQLDQGDQVVIRGTKIESIGNPRGAFTYPLEIEQTVPLDDLATMMLNKLEHLLDLLNKSGDKEIRDQFPFEEYVALKLADLFRPHGQTQSQQDDKAGARLKKKLGQLGNIVSYHFKISINWMIYAAVMLVVTIMKIVYVAGLLLIIVMMVGFVAVVHFNFRPT